MTQNWTPRNYQLSIVKHGLANQAVGANIYAEPGLGKTSSSLAIVKVLLAKQLARKVLVVAPVRVVHRVWPVEAKKWHDFSDISVAVVHGSPARRLQELQRDVQVYVTNYENLVWLAGIPGAKFDTVIFDESSKLKDPSTKRWAAALEIRSRAQRCYMLTGTPRPNNATELYGPQRILDGRLGKTLTQFRKTFCVGENVYIGGGRTITKWSVTPAGEQRIMDAIAPVTITLRAKDHLDLPPLMHNLIKVDMPVAAWSAYRDLEDDFMAQLDAGTINAANAATKSGKLRQVASGCCYSDDGEVQLHDAKLDALEDLVGEMNGEPLLVLVAFEHEVRRIRERLGKDIPYLGGGMSASESNRVIDAWNRGEIPVLLGHPASMGHGLNLQDGGAHTLCWFGLTWSGEQHEQAIARLYRQGQQHPTVVHYILAAGTVDEQVLEVLRNKAAGQSNLLDALRQKKVATQ